LTACVDSDEPDCAVQRLCPMQGGWDKINRVVRGALAEVTLADLAGTAIVPGLGTAPAAMALPQAGREKKELL
jgi:hypothetical protein